jgi:hypothetical protein
LICIFSSCSCLMAGIDSNCIFIISDRIYRLISFFTTETQRAQRVFFISNREIRLRLGFVVTSTDWKQPLIPAEYFSSLLIFPFGEHSHFEPFDTIL